jgi:hypothetical protein
MPSITCGESKVLDLDRVHFVDQIMSDLGFRHYKINRSYKGACQFTELILYLEDGTGDSLAVFFPHNDEYDEGLQITTQANFKNKFDSPEWQSLYEFSEEIASWIEDCRRREGPDESTYAWT